MADQINKRINWAIELTKQASAFIAAKDALTLLVQEYTNSGLTFNDQTDFNQDAIRHLDSQTIAVTVNVINGINAEMDGASGQTAALEKVMP